MISFETRMKISGQHLWIHTSLRVAIRGKICLAMALATLVAGCAAEPKIAKYVAPTSLPQNQIVILRGSGGTYITAVDMLAVPGSGGQFANWGGNKVILSPGKHRITYDVAQSSTMSFRTNISVFEFDFKPGHSYKLGRESLFKLHVVLYDETDKEIQNGL